MVIASQRRYNLPHARTHAIVLPCVLAFNAGQAPDAASKIAGSFRSDNALEGLQGFRAALGAPRALADYGLALDDLPAAAAILPTVPPGNPRPVTGPDLETLLRAAWSGADPAEVA